MARANFIRFFYLLSLAIIISCDFEESDPTPQPTTNRSLQLKTQQTNFLVLTNTTEYLKSGNISIRLEGLEGQAGNLLEIENKNLDSPAESNPFLGPNSRNGENVGDAEPQGVALHAQLPEITEKLVLRQEAQGLSPDFFQAAPANYEVGDKLTFNVSQTLERKNKELLLVKKTTDLNKSETFTTYYWVDPKEYNESNTSTNDNTIGIGNINQLANDFSKENSDEDVLGQAIKIFGMPWGKHSLDGKTTYGDILPEDTRDIHILIHDIKEDGYTKGESRTGGFFFSRDNFESPNSNSNRKLILQLDSPWLSRKPGNMYRILVHEFQHMISYYQKSILRAPGANRMQTWLNEMISEAAVDLLSNYSKKGNKFLEPALRTYLHNSWNSLTNWKGDYINYTVVNTFAAYIMRHHAGNGSSADLMRRIVQNPYTDEVAITSTIGVSWTKLLRDWGKQTLDSYQSSQDLAAINPWTVIETLSLNPLRVINLGIPMFTPDLIYLNNRVRRSLKNMIYFDKKGLWTGYVYKAESNKPKFPQPHSNIFIFLGKPNADTKVLMELPEGIVSEIITY